MKVFNEKEGSEKEIEFSGTAEGLFKHLKLNPEQFLIVKNDTLVTLDEELNASDEVKLLSVISGG